MLTKKKKLLVLSVLTAIASVDFVCNANYNVPIVMDSLVGSIESDMGIKAT